MVDRVLNIAQEFARYPGPRFRVDGPRSGEAFRDEYLIPKLREAEASGDRLVVVLDGARGYTASFLEEAFGGLVRLKGYSQQKLEDLLEIRAKDPRIAYWRGRIREYIRQARA